MRIDLWDRIETILHQALQLPSEQRRSFVERASYGDKVVLAEVVSLLDQYEEDPAYLEEGSIQRSPTEEPEPHESSRVGVYRLIRPIARGGMGQVFLARREGGEFRQYVALKVLRRGIDTDDVLRRFGVERRILASLSHPNIARFLDGGSTDDGLPYFVMEYVDGLPLTEYCDREHFSVERRLELFRKVCGAVQFAHQNLVVHRDLKPSNILVTAGGVPKLLDFGIAKILDLDQDESGFAITRTEVRVLTPDYASPEQVLGRPITTASDIYSLGVLLYEVLTGCRPPRITNADSTGPERAIGEQEPILPSIATEDERIRRRLRGDLDVIVSTALKKDPARRYVSVEQLSEDIRRHLHGLPILARQDTFGYRLRKFTVRHRWSVAAGLVFLLALVLFAAAMVWQNKRVEAQAAEAVRERDRARLVSNFMVSLFESADPTHTAGQEISARELLNRGVEEVEGELSQQPELQAEMLAVLGRVYSSMGSYDRALELSSRALEQRRVVGQREYPEVAASLNDLGSILTAMSRYEEAETAYRQALQARLSALGSNHVDVASTMQDYGWLLILRGRYEEADSLFMRALAIREHAYGQGHPDVAHTLNNIGILQRRRGNLSAAAAAHSRAMEIRRAVFGGGHRWYAQSLNNLAIVKEEMGDHAAADTLLTTAVAVLSRILGEDHPDVVLYMSNLARQRYHVANYDAADSLWRRVLVLQRQRLGDRHRDIALTLVDLGQIEYRRGDLDEAERLFTQALEMRRQVLGEGHHDVGFTLNDLALVALGRGQRQLAEERFRQSLGITRGALPDRHYQHARALIGLGRLLCADSRVPEGHAVLREAWEIRRDAFGEDDRRTAEAAAALDECADP